MIITTNNQPGKAVNQMSVLETLETTELQKKNRQHRSKATLQERIYAILECNEGKATKSFIYNNCRGYPAWAMNAELLKMERAGVIKAYKVKPMTGKPTVYIELIQVDTK